VNDLVALLNDWVWSAALIYLCLGAGLWFSIRTRFVQLRGIPLMIRSLTHSHSSRAGVSSFQALSISLSGRVGTGNIAGVATAITFGGPGAVFWMWVVAFLGASTAFVESTLGQIYKEQDPRGQYRGGPAYYIEKAMGQRWYAWMFAVCAVIATGFLLPGVQANSMAAAAETAWGIDRMWTAGFAGIFLAFIIFGGVRRIAIFAEFAVPFMAVAYVALAVVILSINVSAIPDLFALIIRSAFGLEAGFGAVLGMAIQWGVKRGIYSNEAGQGTGPHAAAAAEVDHPARQGYVQAFSVYVDTLLVCTATALMILSTGRYNVQAPDGSMLTEHLPGVEAGPAYTQAAIDTVLEGYGSGFVAIALFFFTFTTIVAYYYMAETNIAWINKRVHRPWLSRVLRFGIIATVCFGAVRSAGTAWAFGDLGVGLMAWLNIIALFILQRPAIIALRDFEEQVKRGAQVRFEPDKLGIAHADIWRKIDSQSESGSAPIKQVD